MDDQDVSQDSREDQEPKQNSIYSQDLWHGIILYMATYFCLFFETWHAALLRLLVLMLFYRCTCRRTKHLLARLKVNLIEYVDALNEHARAGIFHVYLPHQRPNTTAKLSPDMDDHINMCGLLLFIVFTTACSHKIIHINHQLTQLLKCMFKGTNDLFLMFHQLFLMSKSLATLH